MDIQFSEYQNQDTVYQEDPPLSNYWESTPREKKGKKKVSFTDILSNMNLVVNKQGVLQQIIPKRDNVDTYDSYDSYHNNNNNNNNNQQQSYIYNKYFKDYGNPTQEPVIRVPKTMEEYRQMVLDDRKKALEHKMRIEQIKSTKMLFTTTPGQPNIRNMQASVNHLNMMKFN